MNWGNYIVVAFVFFAVFIAVLVTVCVRQEVNLVSENYYADELVYQQHMDRVRNTQALTDKPTIYIEEGSVSISFPGDVAIEEGELWLWRPSDKRKDQRLLLTAGQHNMVLPIEPLVPGLYRVQMRWTHNQKEYFMEQIISV